MDMTTPLYRLTGVVIHGRGVGKHVGTPTADLALGPGSHLPPGGVYPSRAASGGARARLRLGWVRESCRAAVEVLPVRAATRK